MKTELIIILIIMILLLLFIYNKKIERERDKEKFVALMDRKDNNIKSHFVDFLYLDKKDNIISISSPSENDCFNLCALTKDCTSYNYFLNNCKLYKNQKMLPRKLYLYQY